jgi:carbamate kinase
MGPKVEACADFVAAGGAGAVIAALSDAAAAARGEAGTAVVPG